MKDLRVKSPIPKFRRICMKIQTKTIIWHQNHHKKVQNSLNPA